MNDGLGVEPIASLYGHDDYTRAMHIDSSQAMFSIWDNPNGVGTGGIDVMRAPYGSYTNALLNYHWDHVLVEPYQSQSSTFGLDKGALTNFINLTRQNPQNSDTVFYIYQVWPRISNGNYSTYWEGASENVNSALTRPRRQYYDNMMAWTTETFTPQGILVREIPVGEVWHRINLMIESGAITEITMSDLYRDDLHASYSLGRYLAAATTFATIFQTDISQTVALPAQFGNTYSLGLGETIHRLIWEVVSSDPDTGIADLNDDGYVSSADLANWSNAYGLNSVGDTDGDGDTDGRDFLNWQRNYGGEPPTLISGAIVAIPEPNALALCLLTGLAFALRRRNAA